MLFCIARIALAAVLLVAWQAALQHPIEHVDARGEFVHLPGGPESMVEVKTKAPVKYTFEPMVLSGKLAILKDDPTGVFYRLTDAVPAK